MKSLYNSISQYMSCYLLCVNLIFNIQVLLSYLYLIFVNIANDFANPKPKWFWLQTREAVGSHHLAKHASHPLI